MGRFPRSVIELMGYTLAPQAMDARNALNRQIFAALAKDRDGLTEAERKALIRELTAAGNQYYATHFDLATAALKRACTSCGYTPRMEDAVREICDAACIYVGGEIDLMYDCIAIISPERGAANELANSMNTLRLAGLQRGELTSRAEIGHFVQTIKTARRDRYRAWLWRGVAAGFGFVTGRWAEVSEWLKLHHIIPS
jgi:hypothetical protein